MSWFDLIWFFFSLLFCGEACIRRGHNWVLILTGVMGDQGGSDLEGKKREEVEEKLRIVEKEGTFWLEKLELKDRKRTQHACMKTKFYFCIKMFSCVSVILLGFEIVSYLKSWHFGAPKLLQCQLQILSATPLGVKGVLIGFILSAFCFVWHISPMLFIVFFFFNPKHSYFTSLY